MFGMTMEVTCDLCEAEEPQTCYRVEMPHLVAWRAWLCRDCLLAVRDATEVHELGDDEVRAFLTDCARQRSA